MARRRQGKKSARTVSLTESVELVDEHRLFEGAVLEMILGLHPEHLTIPELVLRMTGAREEPDYEPLREVIRDLRGAGLVRHEQEVIEPTHAAVRAADRLSRP